MFNEKVGLATEFSIEYGEGQSQTIYNNTTRNGNIESIRGFIKPGLIYLINNKWNLEVNVFLLSYNYQIDKSTANANDFSKSNYLTLGYLSTEGGIVDFGVHYYWNRK